MIPKKASIKKRDGKKNQIMITFYDMKNRYFTPVCEESEMPSLVAHINNLITLGKFNPADFIPDLKKEFATLVKFAEKYLQERKKKVDRDEISLKTYQIDYDALKLFTKFLGKDFPISDIDENIIGLFVDHLLNTNTFKKTPYSYTSINIFLRHLKSAFNYAVKHHYIDRNPFLGYPQLKKKENKEIVRFLYEWEIQQLREYFKNQPEFQGDIFDFALNTGLRASGIINAQFSWIRKKHSINFLLVTEKGKKTRDVPLNNLTMEIIEKRKKWIKSGHYKEIIKLNVPKNYWQIAKKRAKDGYIFFELSTVSGITHFFMKAKKRLDLDERITFHSTRHTFATKMIEAGKNIEYVKEVLGHSDIRTTQIYAKITAQKIAKEFDMDLEI